MSRKPGRKISQIFQIWLFVCIVIGFASTCTFTYLLQTKLILSDTEQLLNLNLYDVKEEILDASDQNLLNLTYEIMENVHADMDSEDLLRLAEAFDVSEINLISSDGLITASTYEDYIGYDMATGEQSGEFLVLLGEEIQYVQKYQPTAYDAAISRKYAGVRLPFGGFLQVGYDAERFQRDIDEEVIYAANNRHVGENGSIFICDENFRIVSDNEGYVGKTLDLSNIWSDKSSLQESRLFDATVHGVDSYCSYSKSEGYFIVAMIPQQEAMQPRNQAMYFLTTMEILVFAALFACIYFLIKKLIINNLQRVNRSLSKITDGNLDEIVSVRSNEEFAALSDDINSTVTTLKRYISEAEARIDQELEYARQIQYSALPSVFPPYPNRNEFDIYALMDTAKEVGGDFYDFYLLDESRLAFVVADVSGKGIPAAMFMMRSKTMLKSLVEGGLDLAEAFCKANDRLCAGNDAEMFVTAWMGILDVTNGHLEFVNAGHNPPVILRKGKKAELLKTKANLVLAIMEDMPYRKHTLDLEPGDVLFLYTDGVTEAQNCSEELFGESRLLASLDGISKSGCNSMEEYCRQVYQAVNSFAGDAEQADDITMLGIQYKGR